MQQDITTAGVAAQETTSTGTSSIQLLDFLRLILPEDGVKCWVKIKCSNKAVKQAFTGTLEELADAIAAASLTRGYDIYHACATFKDNSSRKRENALGCKCFWLDVDCGDGKPYADADAGIQAVDEFANKLGIPLPMIVHSGRGIHAYFILSEAIPAAQWTETARLFKRATEVLGLHADPSRTADVASILRPPGTINCKNGATVTVEEGEPVEPISFADFTARIGRYTGITPAHPPAVSPTTSSRLNASANVLGGLKGPPSLTQGYPDGQRTEALGKLAGHLLAKGHSYEDTLTQCRAWNEHNTPPLPDEKLIHDIGSYAKCEAEKRAAAIAHQEQLKVRAEALPTDASHDDVQALLAEMRGIDPLSQQPLLRIIKRKTGMNLGDLRRALDDGDAPESDHLILAREVIEHVGNENLLSTVAHVWRWRDTGVWRSIPI